MTSEGISTHSYHSGETVLGMETMLLDLVGLGFLDGSVFSVREELEKLRVELRDTKLEVARDISEL